MTPEERDIISRFVARVGGATPSGFAGGSVPATQPNLPAIDPEADRFIGEQFASHPEARYRVVQMAFVQEAALAEAQNRIKRLEYDLNQARQAPPQPQSKGLFGGLFGGGQQSGQQTGQQQGQPGYQQQYAPPPPQPSYPPSYQPGMFQQGGAGGSGFLGGALQTAAGVAGGVLAADAISSMFSGGHGMGGFGGGGFGGGGYGGGFGGGGEVINETTVNNYGPQDGSSGDPWAGSGTGPEAAQGDPWSGSGAAAPASDPWSGSGDSGGDSGWSDSGGGDSGGGDSGGSDDSSF